MNVRRQLPAAETRRLFAVGSVVLRYPDDRLQSDVPLLRTAVDSLAPSIAGSVVALLDWLEATPLLESQAHYVSVFDRMRKACLYLSYYLNGDTRRRGMALVGFKDVYRGAGWVPPESELPDFLPVVLEFGAVADVDATLDLLAAHRAGLELLRAALVDASSPYVSIVSPLVDLLPADADASRSAAVLAVQGPPQETVGLEPFPWPTDSFIGART
jgi:nitrate reductase molybdenum cofactor assembly chaperone NarJ/NarW